MTAKSKPSNQAGQPKINSRKNKQARKASPTSRALFQNTLDRMLEGCQILGFDWRYLYLNAVAEIHNRRPNQELLGNVYMEMWPGIKSTQVFAEIKCCLEERVPRRLENRFVYPDGKAGWFELSIQPIEEGVVIFSEDITERKQMEENNARLGAIVESSEDAIIGKTLDGIVTSWNKGAEKIYGYTSDEIEGHDISALIPPDVPEELSALLNRVKHGERIDHYETVRIRKDGQRIDVSLSISPIRNRSGSIIGASTIGRDITAHKRAEREIRRLASFPELNPNPIVEIDSTGAVSYMNPAARHMFPNLLTQGFKHPWLAGLEEVIGRCQQEEIGELKREIQIGDLWYSQPIHYVPEAGCLRVYGSDITERKRAMEALQRSEALLLQTGEIAKVGGWELDLQTMMPAWSLETYRIHEIDPSLQPDLENAINYYAPEARPIIREAVERAIEKGQAYDLELSMVTAKGTPIWVRTTGQAEFREGKCVRLFGTFQDITGRKQAEQQTVQMKRLYATLSQVNQAIVRVKSRDELFQTICDVAVQFGEFALAWVGLLDESTGDVQPVAAHGLDVKHWPFQLVNVESGPVVDGLIASAIRTSRVVTRDDLQTDDTMPSVHELVEHYGYHASAGVPFQLLGNTIGVLNLVSSEAGFFKDQAEIHLLEEMGLDISYALDRMVTEVERKRAEEEIQARSRQLAALLEVGQTLTESLERTEVLQKITDQAAELMGVETSATYLVEGEHLYLGASTPPLPPEFPETLRRAILADHPHIAKVLVTGQSVILPDATSALLTAPERSVCDALGLRTILYVPLEVKKNTIGVLILCTTAQPREFFENEIATARAFSNQAALAIANAGLYADLSLYVKELEHQIAERKRTEQSLRESEERLRLSLQAANQGLYDLNVQSGDAVVNRQYAEMLGYDFETFVETNAAWIERLHPDDRERVAKTYVDYTSGLLPEYRVEFRQRTRDGNWKWILSLGKVIEYDAQGQPLRMLGTHTDITARKRAEERLILSEIRYRRLFESAKDGILILDAETGMIADVNPFLITLLGYSREALLGKRIWELGFFKDIFANKANFQELQEMGYIRYDDLPLETAYGRRINVEFVSNIYDVDDQKVIQCNIRDITERQQSEAQIQRQLKHLNGLRMIDIAISSSFDMSFILDVVLQEAHSQLGVDACAILILNTQLQTIDYAASRGFRSDALHHTQLKLREGYAGQAVLKRTTIHISDIMELGGKLSTALPLERESFVDYYGTPLIVKGEVIGALEIYHRSHLKVDSDWLEFLETLAGQAAIAIDNAQMFESLQRSNANLERRVTERTAELNRANVELEHANRTKDEFLANMSHELRTPLTSILGLSESLLEQQRDPLSGYQERSIQVIELSGRHLLELINDILDLSKIEAGKFDFYPQPISVDEICRSSLSFIKSQATKKSIVVSYTNEASVSQIYADPRRLKQVLVNLLSNAVKFTRRTRQCNVAGLR